MKQYFKQLFEYDKWATYELIGKFEKQFPQNQRIYELLSHMLSSQRIWLDRCLDLPQSVERFQDRLPEEVHTDLENYHAAWINFIDQLDEKDFGRTVNYTTTQGVKFADILRDIITQVINHGTHHRGNITVLMKEEGFVPPALDYIHYLRQI